MTDPREFNRLADLRSANIARQKEWDAGNQLTLAYRGNELAGEVGEACNVIKKLERERLGIAGSRDTVMHLAEELADVIICADLIAMQADIDLDAAVVAKFNASSEKVGLKTRLRAASAKAGEVVGEPIAWLRCAVEGDAPKPCNEDDDGAFPVYRALTEPAKAGDAVLLREAFVHTLASLAAAISLLERTPQAKKAAPSDKMFAQMIVDYKNALEAGRQAALSTAQPDTAAQGGNQSDGGAKAGSSPILANKEDQRTDTHGMMPVGDNAANIGCTGVGPSDTAPAEPVAMLGGIHGVALLRHIQSMLPEAQKAYHTPLYAHPPRSVDVEAIKRALIAAKCDTGDGTYIHCSMDQVARSIAAMIEGNRG